MKKQNLLKLALMTVAMLLFVGAMAQNPPTPYALYDADEQAPTNVDYVTLRTGGSTTMGYYALPDPVYHPTYVGTGALTANFVWNWTIPTFPAGYVAAIAQTGAANYVEITYDRIGNYVVNVAEQASPAFGGCADTNPTIMNVTVISPPSAVITTADPAQICGNQPAATIDMTFTEAIPVAFAGYAFSVEELVERIDPSGVVLGTVRTVVDFVDYPTTGKLNTTNELTGAASPYGFTFTTAPLNVEGGNRTRYTYTLKKATDAPGAAADGLISAISEKSDYLATELTYSFGAKTTWVAVVNPAPNTGPIYHIPNNYAY